MGDSFEFVSLDNYRRYAESEMVSRSTDFFREIKNRRSVRQFSDQPIPIEVIRNAVMAAGTAPSGANLQPWHFAIVQDSRLKSQIREGAEEEERKFYSHRATQEWMDLLAPLGTDADKPFLETAPVLICVFGKPYDLMPDGSRRKNYYVPESVGIATGLLITCLHLAGLVTLTHTPSPMAFLNRILNRPSNERPFVLLVAGYPAETVQVPAISKKNFSEIASFH
jgi:iodotyrosine deiodinase